MYRSTINNSKEGWGIMKRNGNEIFYLKVLVSVVKNFNDSEYLKQSKNNKSRLDFLKYFLSEHQVSMWAARAFKEGLLDEKAYEVIKMFLEYFHIFFSRKYSNIVEFRENSPNLRILVRISDDVHKELDRLGIRGNPFIDDCGKFFGEGKGFIYE